MKANTHTNTYHTTYAAYTHKKERKERRKTKENYVRQTTQGFITLCNGMLTELPRFMNIGLTVIFLILVPSAMLPH